jgi:hypothetical protein
MSIDAITTMSSSLKVNGLAQLEDLLIRKLTNIPKYVIPSLTIADIVQQTPRARNVPAVPPDLQLHVFLSNRHLIYRDKDRPIKDEHTQSLCITRLVFYYHLSEAHQFKRFHDKSRWNLALFTAVLPATSLPTQHFPHVTPVARRFMISYLAAVLERHNTPAIFTAREDFIRRWKSGVYDLFVDFKAAQKKFMAKHMQNLNREWEKELDLAMRQMGRAEYDRRVAPFVGCVVPGRKDQQLLAALHDTHLGHATSLVTDGRDVNMEMSLEDGRNELLKALRVPLDKPQYREDGWYEQTGSTPVEMSLALSCVKVTRPVGMLSCLMAIFPVVGDVSAKR